MYEIYTANKRTRKRLEKYITQRKDIKDKLKALKKNPRRELGAHLLHGRLAGKWSCWFGSNIRMIYRIDDHEKKIIVEAVGSHKIY